MAKAAPDPQEVEEKFRCFLCVKEHQELKVIGDCHHCACVGCLREHIRWFTNRRLETFSCPDPVCRKQCNIPRNGVDGLENFSKLKNVINNYLKLCCVECAHQKRQVRASHLCKDCKVGRPTGKFSLCKDHADTHFSSTATKAHNVIELCNIHEIHLNKYCTTCKCPICDVCQHSQHSVGNHVIKPLAAVVKETRVEMTAIAGRLRKDDVEKKINQTRNAVKAAVDSQLGPLNRKADNVIGNANKECEKLQRESQSLEKQIEQLVKQKATVDQKLDEAEGKRETFTRTKERYRQQMENVQRITVDEIDRVVQKIQASKEKIVAQLTSYQTDKMEKLVGSKYVETLSTVKSDVEYLDTTSERLTPLGQIKENVPKFVPARNNNEIGSMANKKYSSLRKETDLCFPAGQGERCFDPCRVKFLTDGRIIKVDRLSASSQAALRRLVGNPAQLQGKVVHNGRLCLHNPASPTECHIIDTNIDNPLDMTVKSSGDILVLTKMNEIRVVNASTHEINMITSSKFKTKHLQFVETDGEDSIFVKFYNNRKWDHLLVLNTNGAITQDHLPVEAERMKAMSYCKITQILYTVTQTKLSKYHWNRESKVLSRGLTSPHGVDGFSCSDVGIGSAGEILLVGEMRNRETRVYQAVESSDGSEFMLKQLNFEDGEVRISANIPHIAVQRDKMILAYKDFGEGWRLELLKLIQ